MKATATKQQTKATAPRINRQKYADLLAEALPTTITNEAELERFTAIVDKLAVKQRLSAEEHRLFDLLATLIEVYENEHHALPDAPPHVNEPAELLTRGWKVLAEHLGLPQATQFVALLERGKGDSVREIKDYWGNATSDEIHARVMQSQEQQA